MARTMTKTPLENGNVNEPLKMLSAHLNKSVYSGLVLITKVPYSRYNT